MASNVSQPEEDCTCPVCRDLYNDPVLLLCGHSFCSYCIQEWWRQSAVRTCPVCKDVVIMSQLPRNIALKNLSDSLRQERNRKSAAGATEICQLHGEKLKLFCQDDQQVICVICRDAKAHKKHNCVPVNEAAEDRRNELQANMATLKIKRGSYTLKKLTWDKMAAHIQLQAEQTEKKIRADFQKLYQFLRAEEADRIDACRKEASAKSSAMDVKIQNLTAEISELTQKIQMIEKERRADDLSFMLNFNRTKERSLWNLPEPETPTGTLIDEAKHIGNLQFSVWKKMTDMVEYTPVILDPNTGDASLTVSENLTSSAVSEKGQPVLRNPERLEGLDILGHEGFNSGKHSWDVEVGGSWALGVAAKSKDPTGTKIWAISKCANAKVLQVLPPEAESIWVAQQSSPRKVRVQLDYEKGELSFTDHHWNKLVCTVKDTFTETVFPYFRENVKILQASLSVSIQQRERPPCVTQ